MPLVLPCVFETQTYVFTLFQLWSILICTKMLFLRQQYSFLHFTLRPKSIKVYSYPKLHFTRLDKSDAITSCKNSSLQCKCMAVLNVLGLCHLLMGIPPYWTTVLIHPLQLAVQPRTLLQCSHMQRIAIALYLSSLFSLVLIIPKFLLRNTIIIMEIG